MKSKSYNVCDRLPPLLTAAEEIEMSRLIQAMQRLKQKPESELTRQEFAQIKCGQRALSRMVAGNLRMVTSIARKYSGIVKHLSIDDIVQEGNVGLCRAAEKFDPTRGYKFSTYAYWWIRQSINRAISDKERVVRIPCNAFEMIRKALIWQQNFQLKHGYQPRIEQVSDHVGISTDVLIAALRAYWRGPSLDVSAKDKDGRTGGSTLVDIVSRDSDVDPLDAVEYSMQREKLYDMVGTLSEEQKELLEEYYGLDGRDPINFTDMGKKRGVSREAVSQRFHRAINALSIKVQRDY